MSVQAVSKHLQVLEEAGLVSRTRDAQRRPAHLEVEVFDLMTKWIERYRREAAERFERLDELLAERTAPSKTCDTPTTAKPASKRKIRMTTTFDTQIIVDTEVPLVRILHEFAASPQSVFEAHTDPVLFARWNGPRDSRMTVDHFDCRPGGSYRYTISRDGFEAGFPRLLPRHSTRRTHRADLRLRRNA